MWLEEYAGNGILRRIIEMNIANLAGVPSIVYGLLGLGIFVTVMGFSSGIVIIAVAQGMGETAPLIMIGAATTSFRAPQGLFGIFSAMPLQIYAWSDLPKSGFQHGVVPASIVTLLIILLSLNGLAVYLRNRAARKKK